MSRRREAQKRIWIADPYTQFEADITAYAPAEGTGPYPFNDQPIIVIDNPQVDDGPRVTIQVWDLMKLLGEAGFHVHTDISALDCTCEAS